MSLEIKVIVEDEKFIPIFKTVGAAGADLRSTKNVEIEPGENTLVPLGIWLEIPKGYVGKLYIRSSLSKKLLLANSVGIIDSDYRGEVMARFYNSQKETIVIKSGERVAQIIIEKTIPTEYIKVDNLDTTERGIGGFGSTGIK